jgi:polyhydroxyalkanoate synthase subunit PhaC
VMSEEWAKALGSSFAEWNKGLSDQLVKFGGSPMGAVNAEIEMSPSEVVHKFGRIKLLHYKPLKKKVLPVPILIVYALVNKYYILDLQPDRSVVRDYLQQGIDVYVIDWGDPGPSDRYETIADEVDCIDIMVDVIRKRSKVSKVNLHGYCMGGTFCTIYSAQHGEKVNSLVVQAAPIDFSSDSGVLTVWSRHIDADKIVDTFGNVPAEFMNVGFLLVNPVRLLLDKYVNFYQNVTDKEFVENFLRMEKWIFDSPDVPGESYRQFMNDLYKKNLLVSGELMVGDEKVNLKRVKAPLLIITADNDNLVPPDMSRPLGGKVSSRDKTTMNFAGGHIGLSVSPRAHREFWPKVVSWIAKHSSKKESRP